jgi:hypothetical protein
MLAHRGRIVGKAGGHHPGIRAGLFLQDCLEKLRGLVFISLFKGSLYFSQTCHFPLTSNTHSFPDFTTFKVSGLYKTFRI